VDDGDSGITSQTFIVNITGTNDTPVFSAQVQAVTYTDTAATDSFSSSSGTFIATDVDAAATLTYGITDGTLSGGVVTKVGSYGTLAVNASTGAYTFTPNSTAINTASTTTSEVYTVTVRDSSNATANLSFTINVTGVADAPVNSFTATVAVAAGTGGTITQVANASGGFDYVHTFTTTGASTFVAPTADINAQILVVGGGGAGGNSQYSGGSGGGGAGALIYGSMAINRDSTYGVSVGAGGASQSSIGYIGNNGADSSFGSIVATGGGGGGAYRNFTGNLAQPGSNGGSGGGGSSGEGSSIGGIASASTVPTGFSIHDNNGGKTLAGSPYYGAGGGGAGSVGSDATRSSPGVGGTGFAVDISGAAE
jgi:VCBS repeat-containing protein